MNVGANVVVRRAEWARRDKEYQEVRQRMNYLHSSAVGGGII